MKDVALNSTQQPVEASLVASTCAYCGVGCGVDVRLQDGQPVSLKGSSEHPANHGRLCVKGTHLLATLDSPESENGRLTTPMINGQAYSWDEATKAVASRLSEIIAQHGPDAVAFYVSGQLLTEDYYVANKLMKGYIGSANIDTNSRLCMSSAVSAYKRAFGEDVVPCDYTDLETTDLLVLVGSNAAWTHPVLFQRIERAKKLRPDLKIVVIDPRKTASVAFADLHLQIKPGTDAAVFNGLLRYCADNEALDNSYIEQHTQGFDDALLKAKPWTIAKTAEQSGIAETDLTKFYQWFCGQKRVVSFYSMGINQSSSGVDKCNSIINCHLATGKLLKPGCGPFSITGQPNAMGGREVGGLSNQLAAHLDIENPQHRDSVQTFWQSPTISTKPGQKAVDMFDAIAEGKIKAVWVMATNPAVSLPNRKRIVKALETCECVIVSDCVSKNDTLRFADIALPATGWSEKDGTVTNSERRISRQRALVQPYAQARHDWQIMCDVAKHMGFSGFDYAHQYEIFDEWARMTAIVNQMGRQLNLHALTSLEQSGYDQMQPVQWPFNAKGESVSPFADNQFSTHDGKARFIAITPRLPVLATSEDYPFVMNSGRLRDQWHTMTRTGRASQLSQHTPFPTVLIHPDSAESLSITEGDIVTASSEFGDAQAYAQLSNSVLRDACFMPIHFTHQTASNAVVSKLYSSVVDPISGQPESKQVPVALTKQTFTSYISVFSASDFDAIAPFWVKARRQNALHYEIATSDESFSLYNWSQARVDESIGIQGEWISASHGDTHVVLLIQDKQLVWASFLFADRQTQRLFPADWVTGLFTKPLELGDVSALLSAQPDDVFLRGSLVCSCFSVHEKDIEQAVQQGCNTVSALGETLKCGSNCGSCKSELQQIIERNEPIDTHSDKHKQDPIPVRRVG